MTNPDQEPTQNQPTEPLSNMKAMKEAMKDKTPTAEESMGLLKARKKVIEDLLDIELNKPELTEEIYEKIKKEIQVTLPKEKYDKRVIREEVGWEKGMYRNNEEVVRLQGELSIINNKVTKKEKSEEELGELQKVKPTSTLTTGEPTKTAEPVAPPVNADAGIVKGVETGLSQEEQEKIAEVFTTEQEKVKEKENAYEKMYDEHYAKKGIEEELENLDAVYDSKQAEKEAEAEPLRQEIIELVEKSKKLDEVFGRDGGKIKELIEENEEVKKINKRIEVLLLETTISKDADRLKGIKKEILDNLLLREKEKTSLARLGRQLETIDSAVNMVGWPLRKTAEATGAGIRGGRWLLRKGGPLAGKGGVLGLAAFGVLAKDLWKLAKIEAKIAWKGITGHKVSLMEGWREVFEKEKEGGS